MSRRKYQDLQRRLINPVHFVRVIDHRQGYDQESSEESFKRAFSMENLDCNAISIGYSELVAKEIFSSSDITIANILKQVEDGSMQLPEFQRDFVWPDNKQKDLINSIHKGFPTGSLLLMEVDENPQLAFRPIKHIAVKNSKPKTLVLDGQQRVTSVVYTFSEVHKNKKKTFLNIRNLFLSKLEPAGIDLLENKIIEIKDFQKTDYISLLEKEDLLPCSCIFNSKNKADLLGKYKTYLRTKGKSENTFLYFLDRLEPFFERFLTYRFPSIDIFADADLDVVSTIFTKLNTQGQPLTAFDLCLAKYFKQSGGIFQLKTFIDDQKEKDPKLELVDDDGMNFLQAIALHANVEHRKSSLVKYLEFKHIQDHKVDVLQAFKEMSRFFQEVLKCDRIKDIPYDTTIPPLSIVFKKWSKQPVKKRSLIQSKIVKWIIVSGLKKWYTEGTDEKQKEDIKTTIPYILGTIPKEPLDLSEPWTLNHEFIKSSSGSRKTVLIRILKLNSAADFISGNDPNEIHHIFPKKYLKGKKTNAELINSVLNLTLISKSTNVSIGGKSPSDYIFNDIIPNLCKQYRLKSKLAEKKLKDILQKHFIDETTYQKLVSDDYDGFLKARGRAFGDFLAREYNIKFMSAI